MIDLRFLDEMRRVCSTWRIGPQRFACNAAAESMYTVVRVVQVGRLWGWGGSSRPAFPPPPRTAPTSPVTPPKTMPAPQVPPQSQPARSVAITVDNRVTNGMGMREDSTPARLLTQPWVRCTARGCNIYGTERASGQNYDAAVCQTFGERTTNGHDTDPNDDGNPLRFESTRYYGVRLADGTFGFVSETWIRADFRGGLGLPGC